MTLEESTYQKLTVVTDTWKLFYANGDREKSHL